MILIVQILELFEGLKIKVTDDGRVFTLDKHVIRKMEGLTIEKEKN